MVAGQAVDGDWEMSTSPDGLHNKNRPNLTTVHTSSGFDQLPSLLRQSMVPTISSLDHSEPHQPVASASMHWPNGTNSSDQQFPPLATFLSRLSLSHYLETFISEGFDTVMTLCDITEDDFDAMSVKRGHRRVRRSDVLKCYSHF